MVPGFNTDFKYRGETYHVQTEDNGVGNPGRGDAALPQGGDPRLPADAVPRSRSSKPGFEQELMELMKTQHKELMRELLAGAYDKDGAAPAVAGAQRRAPGGRRRRAVAAGAEAAPAAPPAPPPAARPPPPPRAAAGAARRRGARRRAPPQPRR